MGPPAPPPESAPPGTVRLGPGVTVMVSPGRMSGVSPSPPGNATAPPCQQSPSGSNAVGTVVLTVNGRIDAESAYMPITTGAPVIASGRVTRTVVSPPGRPVAITESLPASTL